MKKTYLILFFGVLLQSVNTLSMHSRFFSKQKRHPRTRPIVTGVLTTTGIISTLKANENLNQIVANFTNAVNQNPDYINMLDVAFTQGASLARRYVSYVPESSIKKYMKKMFLQQKKDVTTKSKKNEMIKQMHEKYKYELQQKGIKYVKIFSLISVFTLFGYTFGTNLKGTSTVQIVRRAAAASTFSLRLVGGMATTAGILFDVARNLSEEDEFVQERISAIAKSEQTKNYIIQGRVFAQYLLDKLFIQEDESGKTYIDAEKIIQLFETLPNEVKHDMFIIINSIYQESLNNSWFINYVSKLILPSIADTLPYDEPTIEEITTDIERETPIAKEFEFYD